MIPNQLMKHLSDQGNCTHKAIVIYLEKLKSSQQGTARQHLAKNLISWPFGNHEKLVGVRSATAVHKVIPDGGGENKATGASNHSQQGPASETATAVDKEDTNKKKDTDASDASQTGLQSEGADGGDSSKNGPEVETVPEMVTPGEEGPDDGTDPSQKKSR